MEISQWLLRKELTRVARGHELWLGEMMTSWEMLWKIVKEISFTRSLVHSQRGNNPSPWGWALNLTLSVTPEQINNLRDTGIRPGINSAGSTIPGLSRVRVYLLKVSLKLKGISKKKYLLMIWFEIILRPQFIFSPYSLLYSQFCYFARHYHLLHLLAPPHLPFPLLLFLLLHLLLLLQ